MNKIKGIVWFRNDLRLHDNEALTEAVQACDEILPVYIFDDRIFKNTTSYGFAKTGLNRTRFIIESIEALRRSLNEVLGCKLIVRQGKTEDVLFDLARRYKTRWVFCNRERTREEVTIQDSVEEKMWSIGQEMRYSRGKMLLYTADLPFPVTHTPEQFSTFKKEVAYIPIREPLPIPEKIKCLGLEEDEGAIPHLSDFGHADNGKNDFRGGEKHGLTRLSFIAGNALNGGAKLLELSPWLSQGCISPKKTYHELIKARTRRTQESIDENVLKLLRRDHFRFMAKKYGDLIFLRQGIQGIQTSRRRDEAIIEKWCQGETGKPLIDAAMKALVSSGFLSYRLRLLVSSYFIHELQQDWIVGAEFFESHLVDYDPCSNYGNWNRLAGVGAVKSDESKLNIDHQTKLLDPDGSFVARWSNV